MISNLLIRVDAGGVIGTGHVMRMIALAQAYMKRGGLVVFASVQCPKGLIDRVKAEGIQYRKFDVGVPGSLEDAAATLALAKELSVEWVVTDGYHFDYTYQKQIKAESSFHLLCVDDHQYSVKWHCDAILNQNLDAEIYYRYNNDIADFKPLLGSSFCLLRDEFLNVDITPKPWKKIQCLLVTLGGADPENATEATLRLLNKATQHNLEIRVLAGADNPHVDRLRAFDSQHSIEIVQNARNMPEQYIWADGIISAGGSTCWEWLYFGLPGAIVTIAENQLPIITALTETRKAAISLGWFNNLDFENQINQLFKWIESPSEVCDTQIAGDIVDGFGTNRVAAFLIGSKVMFRKASMEDCAQYLKWANDAEVRKNSFSPNPIAEESHVKWFSKQISDSDSCLLVMVDLEGNNLGQVRFDFNKQREAWVVDFSIDNKYRGDGYGKLSISEALKWMRHRYKGKLAIMANVLNTNPVSQKIFEALKFKKTCTNNSFSSYLLEL